MPNKIGNVTVHLGDDTHEAARREAVLKTLASALGYTYNGNGSLSQLFKALADGELKITKSSQKVERSA